MDTIPLSIAGLCRSGQLPHDHPHLEFRGFHCAQQRCGHLPEVLLGPRRHLLSPQPRPRKQGGSTCWDPVLFWTGKVFGLAKKCVNSKRYGTISRSRQLDMCV